MEAAAAGDEVGDGAAVRRATSSPDVVSAGYNVPGSVPVSGGSVTRVIQPQNDSTTERRPGDVFTALRVDVGLYCRTLSPLLHSA